MYLTLVAPTKPADRRPYRPRCLTAVRDHIPALTQPRPWPFSTARMNPPPCRPSTGFTLQNNGELQAASRQARQVVSSAAAAVTVAQ
jgi:hypothetical protein